MRMPLTLCLLAYSASIMAQPDAGHIQNVTINTRDFERLSNEYNNLSSSAQKSSIHLLTTLQVKDKWISGLLIAKGDTTAGNLFSRSQAVYQQLQAQLNTAAISLSPFPLKDYLPGVDSVQTALRFLQSQRLSIQMPVSLQNTQDKLLLLQNQLQRANNITAFIQQREQQLQQQLQVYHLEGKLMAYKKEAYYYKAQLEQYKALLHEPDRLATSILNVVRPLPAFQTFFQHHSYLSSLFLLPGTDVEATGKPIPGLQTRGEVDAAIAERLGPKASLTRALTNNEASSNRAAGGMQDAHDQLDKWKDKLGGSSGNSNAAMPDFSPNPQHNKTFFQRIQLGFDMQTQSSTNLVPALSTVGLSAGYLLNARSIVGIGAAYHIGFGHPFDHIAFSSQGAVIRSFIDWRLKARLWLAGGYEANYLNAFTRLSQLSHVSAWQQSALIGLMKQYKSGKHTGNVQLLFDALYQQHIPQSQPILFRMGYSLH